MAVAPKLGSLRASAAARASGWTSLAVAGAVVVGRFGASLPVWAWSTGGIATIGALGVLIMPELLLWGMVVIKPFARVNAAFMVFSAIITIYAALLGGWQRVPRVAGVAFAAYLVVALSNLSTEIPPWDTIRVFLVPGTDWEVFPFTSYDMLQAMSLVGVVGPALLVGLVVKTRAQLDNLLTAIVGGAAIPVLFGMKDLATGNLQYHDGYPSIESVFGHPNGFALFLLMSMPIAWGHAASTRVRWKSQMAYAVFGFGLLCLFFTFTRTGWVALVLAAVVGALFARRFFGLAIVTATVVLAASFAGISGTVTERLTDVSLNLNATPRDSLSWRAVTWTRILAQTPDWQITGSGFGSYETRFVEVFGLSGGQIPTNLAPGWRRGTGAHNDYVEQYVESGLLGLSVWVVFLFGLVGAAGRAWRRSRDPLALGAFVSMVGIVIASATENVQVSDHTLFLAAAVVTGIAAVTRDGWVFDPSVPRS